MIFEEEGKKSKSLTKRLFKGCSDKNMILKFSSSCFSRSRVLFEWCAFQDKTHFLSFSPAFFKDR